MVDEWNPLVLSGEYIRSYVCELQAGDVTAFDETVESVKRIDDERTRVAMTNGKVYFYGKSSTTVLVIPREDDLTKIGA